MKKILSILLVLCLLPAAVFAECTIAVSGSASVGVKADCVILSIGLTTNAPTVSEATEQNALGIAAIHAALEADGITKEDRTTQSYNIYPTYEWQDNADVLTGYCVNHILSVTVRDTESAGKVIDHAAKAGANTIYSVVFSCSDTAAAYDEALTAAILDAARKADLMAAAVGKKVTGIVSLTESYGSYTGVSYSTAEDAMAANTKRTLGNSSTSISSCSLSVEANITAVFSIE